MDFNATFRYWQWEMDLLKEIQGLHADWLTPILKFICDITMHGELWIAIAIVLTIYPKTRKVGFTMMCAMILGSITADFILKPLIQRPRPFQQFLENGWIVTEINEEGKQMVVFVNKATLGFDFYIKKIPSDWSFPSGHSVCGFAASTALFTRNKKAAIPAYIVASVIAFGRLYLFVHFPTDVITGICIGVFGGIISFFIVNAIYKKLGKRELELVEANKEQEESDEEIE